MPFKQTNFDFASDTDILPVEPEKDDPNIIKKLAFQTFTGKWGDTISEMRKNLSKEGFNSEKVLNERKRILVGDI